jgi:hypothetical protein
LETGKTNDFFDPTIKQTGGNDLTVDDKYRESVRKFAENLSEKIINYFKDVNENVIKTEGFRQLMKLFSPENIGAYINEIGISLAVDTFIPLETMKLTSDVINFVAAQTKQITYESDILIKNNENKIRQHFDVYKNNLVKLEQDIQTMLCILNKKHGDPKKFNEIFEREKKRHGLKMDLKCSTTGGSRELLKQLEIINNTINNTKTNETLLEQEIYSIVSLLADSKKLISTIDSTNGSSLRDLKNKRIEIDADYKAFKNLVYKLQQNIISDPKLKN